MTSRLKFLALAASAALAIGLIGASAAAATEFTADSYPTTVTGSGGLGDGEWVTEAGSIECEEHYEGTLSEASEVLWLEMSFTNCEGLGFLSATVHMNGCQVGLYSNNTIDISCPPNEYIEVTAGTCVFHVGSQSGLSAVELYNNENHIMALMSVSKLTYNVTKDPFLCPFSGTGHKTGMSWLFNQVMTFAPVSGGSSIALS